MRLNQSKAQAPAACRPVLAIMWLCAAALLLGGCAPPKKPEPAPPPPPPVQVRQPDIVSDAMTPKAYRRDAANHIYKQNTARIYKGKMPPLLMAVAVLEVDIDTMGDIAAIRWARGPTHLPQVMADIEGVVRAAAPYPAPVRMPGVIYTDVWLYDKSGLFQLDTLTEGQRSK